MSDDYHNRALWLSDHLERVYEKFTRLWVWGFTVIVMAMFTIVFNELWALGQISDSAAEALVRPMQLIVGVALVMVLVFVLSLVFGLVGWRIEERDRS